MKYDYVIYSPKHSRGEAIWWRANESGYTRDLNSAGIYTEERARSIEESSHRDAIALRLDDIKKSMTVDCVIDLGRGINGQIMDALANPKPETKNEQ